VRTNHDKHGLIHLGLAAAVAWLGAWFHDFREFAGTSGLMADTLAEILIIVAMMALVWRIPRSRWPRVVLLVFAALWMAGGTLSVLPLAIWPWVPDQSVSHYATHIITALVPIPLIIVLLRGMRRRAVSR
jgi:hypothetical protein